MGHRAGADSIELGPERGGAPLVVGGSQAPFPSRRFRAYRLASVQALQTLDASDPRAELAVITFPPCIRHSLNDSDSHLDRYDCQRTNETERPRPPPLASQQSQQSREQLSHFTRSFVA